jgi:hypothetical protein
MPMPPAEPFHITMTEQIPSAPEWAVAYTITERDGIPIIDEVHVAPATKIFAPVPRRGMGPVPYEAPGGITATLLRQVPMDRSVIARAMQSAVGIRGNNLFSERALENGRRGRGIRHDDRFLAMVAAAYLELLPTSGDVYSDLSDLLAEYDVHYGREGVRELVRKARERRLLTRAPKGRAGGALTASARALLD